MVRALTKVSGAGWGTLWAIQAKNRQIYLQHYYSLCRLYSVDGAPFHIRRKTLFKESKTQDGNPHYLSERRECTLCTV